MEDQKPVGASCGDNDHKHRICSFEGKFAIKVLEIDTVYLPNYPFDVEDVTELKYAKPGDVGIDLLAAIKGDFIEIKYLKTILIPTGVKVAIPFGYEMEIRPKSGKSLNLQLTILNSPGTIDPGYRGEIGLIVTNLSNKTEDYFIKRGERLAQGVIKEVIYGVFNRVTELNKTERGEGGYGSTTKSDGWDITENK